MNVRAKGRLRLDRLRAALRRLPLPAAKADPFGDGPVVSGLPSTSNLRPAFAGRLGDGHDAEERKSS